MLFILNKIVSNKSKMECKIMGYKVKIQRVDRKTTESFYINFPAAIAEVMQMEKGEEYEWEIEDKNTLFFRRVQPLPPRNGKS